MFKIPYIKLSEHEPEPATTTNGDTVIFYDKPLHTVRYIEGGAIKPDIVVWDRKNQTAKIIEVSVPNDFALNKAEREKITKCQDLQYDLKDTWNLKEIEIIPVVVSATGLIKKNLKPHLQMIPGCPSIEEVQLSAIKGSVGILKCALGHKSG